MLRGDGIVLARKKFTLLRRDGLARLERNEKGLLNLYGTLESLCDRAVG